jgi:signal peptidase I
MSDAAPKRYIAIVLALLAPCGTAQFYAGLRRRALFWLGGTCLGLILTALAVVTLNGAARLVAVGLLVAVLLMTWLGPVVDMFLLPVERFVRTPIWAVVSFALVALAVSLAVRSGVRRFALEAFKIPSGGMLPTLALNDHLFVDKSYRGAPKRGDVIVFEFPDPDASAPRQDFIKRVVALPGDTLELEDGHPIINGFRVPSCRVGSYEFSLDERGPLQTEMFVEFLAEHAYLVWFEHGASVGRQGPYRINSGESWVLGDNRNNSSDSRAWHGGQGAGVPDQNVKGRALFVWLAFGTNGNVNGSRIGVDVHGGPELPEQATPEMLTAIRRCMAARPRQTEPPAPHPI